MTTEATETAEDIHASSSRMSLIYLLIVGAVATLLSVGYCYDVYLQRSTAFFDAQFLHLDFLRALDDGQMTQKAFFTRWEDHLFPGYNLLLWLNLLLFRIDGNFDHVVYCVVTIGAAFTMLYQLLIRSPELKHSPITLLLGVCVAFCMLSTVANPHSSMAMAAHIGTSLLIPIAMLIAQALQDERSKWKWAALPLVTIIILLFTGGYGIGVIAAVLCAAIAIVLTRPSLWVYAGSLAATTIVSTAIYVWILISLGSKLSPSASNALSRLPEVIQFELVMAGGSVLGWAFREANKPLELFYACGVVLMGLCLYFAVRVVIRAFTRKLTSTELFLAVLLAHSLVITIFISIVRIDQPVHWGVNSWYNTHVRFMPIVGLWQLSVWVKALLERTVVWRVASIAPAAGIVFIMACAWLGYSAELKKSPAVAGWKDRYVDQAPILLATVKEDADRSDNYKSMQWFYDEVKPSLVYFYEHNLWMFKSQKVMVTGLEEDGWLTSDRDVTIVCPAGSTSIDFNANRKAGWVPATIEIKSNDGSAYLAVTGGRKRVPAAQNGVAAIVLTGRNVGTSIPHIANDDPRKLVAAISNVGCPR